MRAGVIHLFSKWHPSEKLLRQLAEAHLRLARHNLSDIPAPDLEANRAYSIWAAPGHKAKISYEPSGPTRGGSAAGDIRRETPPRP
jgi:hypothetical protein